MCSPSASLSVDASGTGILNELDSARVGRRGGKAEGKRERQRRNPSESAERDQSGFRDWRHSSSSAFGSVGPSGEDPRLSATRKTQFFGPGAHGPLTAAAGRLTVSVLRYTDAVSAPAISVRGLTKRYAGKPDPALRDVSFEVEPGIVLGLVGPNGAGTLVAQDGFVPGTNFSAWIHRIMINHFISGVRSRREFTDMDSVPEVAVQPAHEDRTALRELGWALDSLPPRSARGVVHDRAAGKVV